MIGEVLEALLAVGLTGAGAYALKRWGLPHRPQPVRKPVQIETTHSGVVSLADVVAHLTATGSTVADEFLTDEDRQDLLQERSGTLALFAEGGVLLLPDGTDVAQHLSAGDSPVVPLVVRTSNPAAVRRLEHGTRAALAREAARVRRAAYDQLLRDRSAARRGFRAGPPPEPTVGPAGPSGVSSANRPNLGRPRPHGQADSRNLPVQANVPRPPPRPSPGRPTRQ